MPENREFSKSSVKHRPLTALQSKRVVNHKMIGVQKLEMMHSSHNTSTVSDLVLKPIDRCAEDHVEGEHYH
jgi:hypothetical protein